MLFVRVNGKDRAVPNAHDLRLMDVARNMLGTVTAAQSEQAQAADTQALIEAARQGDTKTTRRVMRRIERRLK